jgi:hypothetical protein
VAKKASLSFFPSLTLMAQTKGQHNFVNLKSHEDKVFLKKKKKVSKLRRELWKINFYFIFG